MAGEHVPVHLDFEVGDHASTGIAGLARAAEGLSHKFDHVSEVVSHLLTAGAGIGAAFGIHHLIEETQEHIATVARLANVTGLAAEKADSLTEALELGGIAGDEAASILQRISLQALKIGDAAQGMGGAGGGANLMRVSFAHLGVDLRKGIIPSMIALSERVKAGKVNAVDLQRTMRLMPESAFKLIRVLQAGPEALRETLEEAERSGTMVTQENIDALYEMRRAKNEVASSWQRVSLVVGRELLPVITQLLHVVESKAKAWVEHAKDFGHFLKLHLREGIGLAVTLGKVLLANAALQKATGMGIVTAASRGFGAARGWALGGISLAGFRTGGALGLASGIGNLTLAISRISVLAAAVGILVAGFKSVYDNVGGIRDFLVEGFQQARASVGALYDALTFTFGAGGPGEESVGILGGALPLALRTATDAVRGLVDMLSTFVRFVRSTVSDVLRHPFSALSPSEVLARLFNSAAEAQAAAQRRAGLNEVAGWELAGAHSAAGRPVLNQNFPNARFDITQKFEGDVEADRVLTAFTHDLASLGERGLQSAFSPLYAVPGIRGP